MTNGRAPESGDERHQSRTWVSGCEQALWTDRKLCCRRRPGIAGDGTGTTRKCNQTDTTDSHIPAVITRPPFSKLPVWQSAQDK